MAKRNETISIEKALDEYTQEKAMYGCNEVTLRTNSNNGNGEIVDFMTMDTKGTIRAYEIKVSIQDLKSKAKKSWVGHYNYLVISYDLWEQAKEDIFQYIPEWVGVIKITTMYDLQEHPNLLHPGLYSSVFRKHINKNTNLLEFCIIKKAKKQMLDTSFIMLCKDSLIRRLYNKYIYFENLANTKERIAEENQMIIKNE